MPLCSSNDIEYWKPEHPPPTTPIRRPAGIGSCVAIISRTLLIAAGVRVTGCVETGGAPFTTSAVGVTVAVAIGHFSLYIYLSSVIAHHRSGKLCIRNTAYKAFDAARPIRMQSSANARIFIFYRNLSKSHEAAPLPRECLHQHLRNHTTQARGRDWPPVLSRLCSWAPSPL